jgi:hypothetical protein
MQFHAGAAVMKDIMCSMHIRYVEHDVGLNEKHFAKIHFHFFAKLHGEIPAKPMTLGNIKILLPFCKNNQNLGRKWSSKFKTMETLKWM